MRRALLILTLLTVACGGVTDALDEDGWQPAPPFDSIDVAHLALGEQADAVQLRRFDNGAVTILSETGPLCAQTTDPERCGRRVDGIDLYGNLGPQCLPGDCGALVLVRRGDNIEVLRSADDLRDALAPIDAPEEALLLVSATSYWWTDRALEDGAVHATDDGWEFIGRITVSDCDPYVEERRHLRIDADGTVGVIGSEEVVRDNGCV